MRNVDITKLRALALIHKSVDINDWGPVANGENVTHDEACAIIRSTKEDWTIRVEEGHDGIEMYCWRVSLDWKTEAWRLHLVLKRGLELANEALDIPYKKKIVLKNTLPTIGDRYG